MTRRHLLGLGAAAAILAGAALSAMPAAAQGTGNRSLQVIVPYAAGGATDGIARQLAQTITTATRQNVVVENRSGGATVIAAQAVASAPPDGNTLGIFDPSTVAMNQFLFRQLPYDPGKSFRPVTALVRIPFALMVKADFPARTLAEFVAYAKANPGLSCGSSGTGNPVHLALELFVKESGLQVTHVPYRGGAPAVQDMIAGHLPCMMMDIPGVFQHIEGGRVRALAVTTADRASGLPNVPTIAESGYPGFQASSWFAAFVPAATPPATVARLNATIREAVASPQLNAWIRSVSFEPFTTTEEELARLIEGDATRYAALIRQLDLRMD